MLASANRRRLRYDDLFRAIGHALDEQHFKDIFLMETGEGFLVKGSRIIEGASSGFTVGRQTFLLSNAEIEALVVAASERRRTSQSHHKQLGRRSWFGR